MKYFISTDINGYVLTIKHTNSRLDFIELDLSQYDLSGVRIHAYKVGKDKLIFDEDRYEELVAQEQEIDNQKIIKNLKQKLNDTDYLVSRTFEQVMELNNPLTFIADVLKITTQFAKKYKEVIENRKAWREEIQRRGG